MKAEEYFGDWMNVIDRGELLKIMNWLGSINTGVLCPSPKNIFKAFQVCSYNDCKVVFLGQDPYPQKDVATGILFGNSKDTLEENLSPSLKIVKDAVIDYTAPHNLIEFDNSLESWARQGILMINTAFTCQLGRVGSHFEIWKPFVSKLMHNLSTKNNGLIYVLFGNQAKSFKKDIVSSIQVFDVYHPAYYARRGDQMPGDVFKEINILLKKYYNSKIKYYIETEYGNC